jgi:class 3 adenylate cyclase
VKPTAPRAVSNRLSCENRGPGLAEGRVTAIAACRTCGTEQLEDARFCHGCGSPVQDGDTRAEYKQVTVLFADVVHSMDLATTVGAERLREIMTELVNRCAAVVQRYGGTVDKFTGDGVMAVFGAPVALEDHAVRACMAALGIQEEAKRLAAEVEDRDGVDLRLRVGLNSGQVIAGEIGSGPFGYTAVGEQVGMAQRMESVASPGGVMLSAATARLVDGAAALGEPEIVRIKGADEPVTVYRLLSVGEHKIDPDARRRRLTALLNAASLARQTPAVYVVEDAHWIDEVSESMITDFLTVIPQTPSLVLVTYRPEYEEALTRVHGTQTIALAPLSDPETLALIAELLGPDPSNGALGQKIAERAAGNPFFAEEMVRELAESGVLGGQPGAYLSAAEVSEVSVPATLQATVAARIDRLDPAAKRTLSAAAVIGSKFSRDLLETLGIDPAPDDLVVGELIDQVRFTRQPEYVFHHPLIRTVAYESQLKSDRAELHRRVAAAIESHDPAAAEENAALIAEHLEAAGESHAAYGWHMRAATRATNRDIGAARLSWERAQKIGDALSAEDPNRAAMRIAPRAMLCGIAVRIHLNVAGDRFEELRQLCTAAGDKASLAIGMAALVIDHAYQDRVREASQLASEAIAFIESLGDPTLTVGLSMPLIYAKIEDAEHSDVLRWSQRAIDLADGDPSKGDLIVGSPLAFAFTTRGMARYWLGRAGWRDDQRHGLGMARSADPMSYATVVTYVYSAGIPAGVLTPNDSVVHEIEDALRIAERSADDLALAFARWTLGVALVHRHTDAERDRGEKLLAGVGEEYLRRGHNLCDLSIVNVYLAREIARRGDRDEALPLMRAAVDHLFREGQLLGWGVPATGVLVETLLDRGADGDVAEAEAAIERLASAPADDGLALRDIWLLRMRALLAQAHGDAATYAHFRDRYRDMARTLGFEGHIAWAEEMS